MIRSTSYSQHDIIRDVLKLHCPHSITLDPTYSKGVFYRPEDIPDPLLKYDLHPQTVDTEQSNANDLPVVFGSVPCVMFDPPFIVGHREGKPTGIIGTRFNSFKNIKELWAWYDSCLTEFHRIIMDGGTLIFKCQDTVSSGKQWLSHVHIINEAERLGFYTKDMFVLLAKSRIPGHNHANQKHARKFHSYFLVFERDTRK